MSAEQPDPVEVDALLDALCDLDAQARARFLDERRPDLAVREQVERLLARLDAADGFLEDGTARFHDADVPLPERIGPYEVEGLLGSGGMGVVYLAWQSSPRRKVALKVLHAGVFGAAQARRFEHEAELLARLQHSGIAHIIEFGAIGEGPVRASYIAMELVEGRPLTEAARELGLDERGRVELLVRVAEAVHYAHLHGVVHRDLKPSNVLVTADGRPKVIDFGVARALDRDRGATLRTATGQVVGTLAYMSPEQVSGDPRSVDARTDVYSLGVLAYELLAGRLPHDVRGLSIAEAARDIQEVEPPRLGRVRLGVQRDLEWIVAKALAKEPAKRYQSAAALAADLSSFLRGMAVEARPPSTLYQLSRIVRRNRPAFAAAGAALLAILVGSGVVARYAWVNVRLARANSELAETEALARERAEAQAARVALLSDADRLTVSVAKAQELHPAGPGMAAALDEWLARRAGPLREHLPLHEARLAELSAKALPPEDVESEEAPAPRFLDPELQERHDATAALVRDLYAFFDPDTGVAAEVARAREHIDEILWRTVGSPEARDAWAAAAASIARTDVYRGLELAPQVGLLPLGTDPRSGLWEFWHPQSGERPADGGEGESRWRLDGETALVFVLLPGGPATIGAQSLDPAGRNYDPRPRFEGLLEVELEPFFLSKYEMTQAQWRRVSGESPSEYGPDFRWHGEPRRAEPVHVNTEWNPVERVSWLDCDRVLGRLGLRLPSSPEWEYGARGGTDTPWWTGREPASLEELRAANLADAVTRDAGGPSHYFVEDWLTDGWVVHAPAGTFAPNPFGLHDVHGNVWEWCADLRSPDSRFIRGGSFNHGASHARSSYWEISSPDVRAELLGVRPARSVD